MTQLIYIEKPLVIDGEMFCDRFAIPANLCENDCHVCNDTGCIMHVRNRDFNLEIVDGGVNEYQG